MRQAYTLHDSAGADKCETRQAQSLTILHIHKDLTDSLDLTQVANDFVFASKHRSTLFGRFLCSDM